MITIGMAAYGNADQVWFTCQALRLYQDMEGCELLVLDNEGNDVIKKAAHDCRARYESYTEVNGTGPARNKIFDLANHPFVLVIDSHVFLWPDALKRLKWWLMNNWDDARNLIHGPMLSSGLDQCYTHYNNQWRADMWGTWCQPRKTGEVTGPPIEIEMMGCGVFGCRKDSWLRFHPGCRGFAGVEGVIHEKYRRAGRKVLCLPFLKWAHKFYEKGAKIPYPLEKADRIRNFLLGFAEIGLDAEPLYEHYGREVVEKIAAEIEREGVAAGQGDPRIP